jgi:hypothetical protein
VQIVISEEEYEGKRRNKVQFINARGAAGVERMEAQEAVSFAAQLRARLTGRTTQPPAKKARPVQEPARDDGSWPDENDCPF